MLGGLAKFVVCEDSLHRHTSTSLNFSIEEQYRRGLAPFVLGFRTMPYSNADALEAAIDEHATVFSLELAREEVNWAVEGIVCVSQGGA